VACTHAHSDHWGQSAPIIQRAGCEMWMHPRHEHAFASQRNPEAAVARRLEVGRQSGVSEAALAAYAERVKDGPTGVAEYIEPDRDLVPGVEIETDLGVWSVHETPGHAPSHVCLFQAERRLLISGDHVLGRISLFYDYGWTPDPVGEFLGSLDRVDELDARLALSGHGKPFVDVHGHIEGNRRLVHERLEATVRALDAPRPRTAVEIVPEIYGEPLRATNANWFLAQTLAYLRHLERQGRIRSEPLAGAEGWVLVRG
jgi:glyoxylase-like metal-dependent hydrolase (beta-lactamase superfamily II)